MGACSTDAQRVVNAATSAWQAWSMVHGGPAAVAQTVPTATAGGGLPRVYVDAGFHASDGMATAGAAVLSSEGEFMACFNMRLPHCLSPLMAEALACKEALSWLKDKGLLAVQLHTDCRNLQHHLTSQATRMRTYIGYIIDGCRTILSSFNLCSVVYIPRLENLMAHSLASHAFTQTHTMYWDTIPPDFIAAYL
ncbi:PREDICTED: uncharacterized protein LOC109186239 [Ipomoea nil]|uniref:uncharacterized protein LOC109186239 n=1 Tax=Ipomoea nil TaxID=35883 RepID=UPI000901F0A3|nr:PREDICTED: uncharacterized protein LOC109186239 [Ipomoea nil]